jgi:hypothetical protein
MEISHYHSKAQFNNARTEVLHKIIRFIEMKEDFEIDKKTKMTEIKQIIEQEGKLSIGWEY